MLTPLLNAAVYYFIFGLILGQPTAASPNYIAFLVTGVFVFTFTQRSVTAAAKSISGNLSLIRALHFPRACAAARLRASSELQQLAISMGVLVVIVLVTGEPSTWLWLLIPVALLLQTLFNVGAALVIARIGRHVATSASCCRSSLRTWLYASGVFFSIQDKRGRQRSSCRSGCHRHVANPAAVVHRLMRDIADRRARLRPRRRVGARVVWAVFALSSASCTSGRPRRGTAVAELPRSCHR